ncbi:MAG: sulfatase-like hydrolase/transferase [bacterium]|nr:sulfatase-like hydrolase/transferase [bacterium]
MILGAALLTAGACAPPAERPPNVVVILVDDLGYRDLGCQGCVDFETPNIDALAAGGVRLTQGYVSHPYCSPSRAAILTGRYQQRFGHDHNPRYDESDDVTGTDTREVMLPKRLAEAGYRTGHLGKWHVGAGAPFRPLARGYDEFFGFLGGGHDYFRADGTNEYAGALWRGAAPTEQAPSYLTDDLTNEALAFIERNAQAPFFLLLAYNAPHSPNQVTPEYLEPVAGIAHAARRKYAGLVRGVDAGVGRVMAALKEHGIDEDTLVVFLSDNGGRRGVSDNRPLRGNKGWLHEGGLRVPFLFRWPGRLPAGVTYDGPVSALDVLPTALAQAGIEQPRDLDGVDVVPFLAGEREGVPHETLHWRVCGGGGWAIRHGDWKLVQDVSMESAELYDLSKDVGESTDLAVARPAIVRDLARRHAAWNRALREPVWTDGHARSVTMERTKALDAGTRQYPMPWVPRTKPNFVLILADDCTWSDMEVYGGQARTPSLMALAARGMVFANCFQAAPMCSPTRHCLYTGLYPVKSGAWPNHTRAYDGVKSIAHHLSSAGYRTHLSGKKHIGPKSVFPFETSGKRNPDNEAVDVFLAECARDDVPFLLIAASNEPHAPWNRGDASAHPPGDVVLPPVLADTPRTRELYSAYLAEITYFDGQVGSILSSLEANGHSGDTLVLVLSEQGSAMPFAKWTCYDAGLRSGLVAAWPGRIAHGARSAALVEYVDVVPTLLEAAGIERPAELDGASFLPVLTGSEEDHKQHVFGLQTSRGINDGPEHYGIRSVRDARYRYILNLTPDATFQNVVTEGADKFAWRSWEEAAAAGDERARELVHAYRHRPAEELYDCIEDPWNRTNLIGDESLDGVARALRAELDAWMRDQGDSGQGTEMRALERMPRRDK